MSSSANRIPNLWGLNEDAERLYRLYLVQLSRNDLHERVIHACRRIRSHAAAGPGLKDALFTFYQEIDSLYQLESYQTAWRQLQLRDAIVLGKRIKIEERVWKPGESRLLEYDYAPIHFFLKRYEFGCSLLETGLSFWFKNAGFDSYDILNRVYNGDQEPWDRCRVTLANFYDHLGKRLSDWQHWRGFASSFDPKLYKLGGISQKKLQANSDLLPQFFDNLAHQKVRRIFHEDGRRKSYMTASSPKFLKYRKEQDQKRVAEEEQNRGGREQRNEKLRKLFPELNGLLK